MFQLQKLGCIRLFVETQCLFHEEYGSVCRLVPHAIRLPILLQDIYLDSSFLGIKFNASPLIQCLFPVVSGPSLKTWPRCPPQVAQCSSVLVYPSFLSVEKATLPLISLSKLGQPVPLSNLCLLSKTGVPHPAHTYVPIL